ncbi:hypothetical protein HGRIS_010005 [Hohenbuehelia grisea]|uniref:chitin deacetylase n=1 Tax=Hohenbuehelia grisea TaxID=104357 RepID=A0ABR3J2Y5_9AGAR
MKSTFVLLAASLVSARLTHQHLRDHSEIAKRALPDRWFQDDAHPVHQLFKRAPSTDGVKYAEVGSSTWSAAFPEGTPDVEKLPAAWVKALDDAVAAGKIPNIPVAKDNGFDNPTYPQGVDPVSPEVCSATYKCRVPGDVWDGPDGTFSTSFDDGPLPPSTKLNSFLKANNERATHFMIGVNIRANPKIFTETFEMGNDIAVHTYTHPHMTAQSNKQILGQLGWTMEIIHNSTGGRIPRYWRPPFGDYDVRVRAVAREVFGLEVVIWNQDTDDWTLTEKDGTTPEKISASMNQWLTGPKSPGLIVLEHELSDQSVQAFMDAYPAIKKNGWKIGSLAKIIGDSAYQNTDPSGNVRPGIVAANVNALNTTSSSSSSSSQSGSTTSTTPSSSSSSSTSTSPSASATNVAASSNSNKNGGLQDASVSFALSLLAPPCALLLSLL